MLTRMYKGKGMFKDQRGLTIVEVLVVIAILAGVMAVSLKFWSDYTNREQLSQGVQIFSSNIDSVFHDVRSSVYPKVDGVECYSYEDNGVIKIAFRNNPHTEPGWGEKCQLIGKVIQLGNDPSTNVGGCIKTGNICTNDPTHYADSYTIYTLMAAENPGIKIDSRINFRDLPVIKAFKATAGVDQADYPHNRTKTWCNYSEPSNIALSAKQDFYCGLAPNRSHKHNPDGSTDPLTISFDTTLTEFLPQGISIKTSYVWNDHNGDELLDANEITYIDGFAIINAEYGVTIDDADGFTGGSRDIQLVPLYKYNSNRLNAGILNTNFKDDPTRVRLSDSDFASELEKLDFYDDAKLSTTIIICTASAGGSKIIEIDLGGEKGNLTAEPNYDGEEINKKCGDLPV